MTVDELIRKLNDGWAWSSLDISIRGDGKWTAALTFVTVRGTKGEEMEQPCMKADSALEAIAALVKFLRGKRVCYQGSNGCGDGKIHKVPQNLEIPKIR